MRPLDAEVLIDALNQITGDGGAGTRARSRSRTRSSRRTGDRSRSPTAASGARSSRRSGGRRATPGWPRNATTQPTAAQRLYLLNSGDIQRKLQQGPKLQALLQRAGRSAGRDRRAVPDDPVALSDRGRNCSAVTGYSQAAGTNRRGAAQDLAWALINTRGVRVQALARDSGPRAEAPGCDRLSDGGAGEQHVDDEAGGVARGLVGAAGPVVRRPRRRTPVAPRPPTGRAKAVIQIWMWGGPCHLDTFDPKPDAGYDYCGPLAKAIPTNVDGIQIGELLPLLAKQADKYSLIRSMTHGINAHETAAYAVQTGRKPGDRLVYPGVGAIVSLMQGLRRRLHRPHPALHRPDRAAGALLGIRLPRAALRAVRHRRRSGPDAVRRAGRHHARHHGAAPAQPARPAARARHARRRGEGRARRSRRSRRPRTRPTS